MTEQRPTSPLVSVVVPAFNEARNLEIVLPRLRKYHQVVVVDGGSTDDTVASVRRVAPWAELIDQTRRGKSNALVCGFARATGDVIVMFDADGSADPAEIDRFVEALVDGADFAKGSRSLPTGGSDDITIIRGLGNRGLTWLTNVMFRARFTDLCYGYNAFWRSVVPRLGLPDVQPGAMVWGDGFEIETVLNCRVARARLAVTEVPSHELTRIRRAGRRHDPGGLAVRGPHRAALRPGGRPANGRRPARAALHPLVGRRLVPGLAERRRPGRHPGQRRSVRAQDRLGPIGRPARPAAPVS